VRRRSEKYLVEGSKYTYCIGLYLNFHLNWVLGPFVHGRLQNLQASEVTFAHVITPVNIYCPLPSHKLGVLRTLVCSINTNNRVFYPIELIDKTTRKLVVSKRIALTRYGSYLTNPKYHIVHVFYWPT